MEEVLTECLFRDTENIFKRGRDTNLLEGNFKLTRRQSESLNSILAMCSSQNTPESDVMENLLDEFQDLVGSSLDLEVLNIHGHELGVICVKIMSAIERTKTFEILFSKLMSVINNISKNNSDVWKATARQILNIFINKKFSPVNFEKILNSYTGIVSNINTHILYNFSQENLPLLKTFSFLVQQVGDFETQLAIIRIVFIHLSKNLKLMADFFALSNNEKALFQSLKFDNFDGDCRLFLNALNKHRLGGFSWKVYSISCHVLHLRGCLMKPLMSDEVIWVDANEETERVSIKCAHFDSEKENVIYLTFSEIRHVQIEEGKTGENCCITIWADTLKHFHYDMENSNIRFIAESKKDVFEFVSFLKSKHIEESKKREANFSKTKSLFISQSLGGAESPVRSGSDSILLGNISPETQVLTPRLSQDRKIVPETQEPHFIYEIPEGTLSEDTTKDLTKTQQCMNSQEKFFLSPLKELSCFKFGKEIESPHKQKTSNQTSKPPKNNIRNRRILRELKVTEATSHDCFLQNTQHKKPSLPKLKRKKAPPKKEKTKKQPRQNSQNKSLSMQEMVEQPKPSLLDPNGYTYTRWMKKTTSERSNFWMRKLDDLKKQKADVYEFTDSDSEENGIPKLPVKHSERKYNRKRSYLKRTENLRNVKKPIQEVKKPSPAASPKPEKTHVVQFSSLASPQLSAICNKSAQSDILNRRRSTPKSPSTVKPPELEKTGHSQKQKSRTCNRLEEKFKTQVPTKFLPAIKGRLQKAEDKTNEIIATIEKSISQLLNHSQRTEEEKITSYLNAAEEVSKGLEEVTIEDLNLRARRLQKIVSYIETWCSVSELYRSMREHFDKIRDGFKNMEFGEQDQSRID